MLVRPYRHGDELRRVHWRSTARHDELMVRLEERPWRGGITVLLDRRDGAHRGHGAGASLEFAISLAASVVRAPDRPRRAGDAGHRGRRRRSPARAGTGPDALLDALAAMRPSARRRPHRPRARRAGRDVVAVLGRGRAGRAGGASWPAAPRGGHAVLLDTATWEPARPRRHAGRVAPAAAALRRAGWQVAVADAGTTPDRVWDELTAAAAPESAS